MEAGNGSPLSVSSYRTYKDPSINQKSTRFGGWTFFCSLFYQNTIFICFCLYQPAGGIKISPFPDLCIAEPPVIYVGPVAGSILFKLALFFDTTIRMIKDPFSHNAISELYGFGN